MSLLSNPFDPAREAALVTGAGNGIGRAIAQALVAEGVRTIFADIREDTVAAAASSSAQPKLAIPWVGDLARRDACDALLAEARSALGLVTHFVHSAAPARREADHSLAVTRETWERMHAVNIDAGFHLARELARQLIAAREPGSFLMLTSLHANTPRNLPHYSTAKAALAMLQGAGQNARAFQYPRECAGVRRHRRRRLRCRPGAGTAHSAGPDRGEQGSRTHGACGPLEPDLRLRHRRGLRGRRRPVADQLV